jgi:pimeloyl-ACP methyl ester carboxylesterase
MQTSFSARLTFVPLLGFALACDAQQPTSPVSRNTQTQATLSANRGRNADNTTIVLVHGAWADGTGWQELIPLLQKEGYKVIAVQNPLDELAHDVATTKRVIDAETGRGRKVVAVGHSYGGAVISGAAAGNAGVKALVYVAAFAPDANEPVGAFLQQFPTELPTAFEQDAAGFVYLKVDQYHDIFAGDIPLKETRVMAVSQKPAHGTLFGQSNPAAAWRSIDSWYIVAQEDRALHPDMERFFAKRMADAGKLQRKIELRTSHLPYISQPKNVARVILEAASK